VVFAISSSSAQLPSPSETAGKTAAQAFKNIQVLKEIPADQLIPSMQFIGASLGVECEFCHAGRAFEKDDKKEKQTARQMITMMFAINKENFDGRRQVTCYSCHRGSHDVSGTPAILEAAEASDHAHEVTSPGGTPQNAVKQEGPSAEQVIDKYLQALGGIDALSNVTTRVEHGHINFGGRNASIDVFAKAPDKRLSVMHMPNGDSITAFDGKAGWLGNAGHPPREMNAAENIGAQIDAELSFPQNLKQMFEEFSVGRPEKIGNQDQTVVFGRKKGQPPVKMYFDPQTGFLTRVLRFSETPLGRLPVQVDFSDYREIGKVKVPEEWTLARPAGRFTIKIDQVDQQKPIADSKFAQPAGAPPADGGKSQ
jgi:hypothetical protein